jgi:ribosomal protein L37AE/L43A
MIPVYAAIRAMLHLKRKCPKCKRDQVVKPSQKTEIVSCKFCTEKIPPSRKKLIFSSLQGI